MLKPSIDGLKIGDWCFVVDNSAIWLAVPSQATGRELVRLPLGANDEPDHPTGWDWDGNCETPTLSPSINVIGHWHGWLKAGKLETA